MHVMIIYVLLPEGEDETIALYSEQFHEQFHIRWNKYMSIVFAGTVQFAECKYAQKRMA